MSKKLLIVEDDVPLRQMLSWEFEDLGYLVAAHSCCSEALAMVQEQEFDLALLDYHLPDGLGSELMQQLRHHQPDLPVVLCSGNASPAVEDQVLLIKAVCFVSKPVSARDLHQLFEQMSVTG